MNSDLYTLCSPSLAKNLVLLTAISLCLAQCKPPHNEAELNRLEQALAAHVTPALADSLANTYVRTARTLKPDDAVRLRYFTRAADIHLSYTNDGRGASHLLHEGLTTSQSGDRAAPAAVLARLWYAHAFKAQAALNMYPEEIDQTKADLRSQAAWVDTALHRIDNKITANITADTEPAKAQEFMDISEGYAYALLEDQPSKAGDLLLKAAALAKTVNDPKRSLRLYYQLSEKIPNHPKAPAALFMQGFIYENDLSELAKAKETYQLFLQRYPTDPDYADDAQNALKLLGKSPEELIKMFEKEAANQQ